MLPVGTRDRRQMRVLRRYLRYPCKDLLVVMEPVPSYEDLTWLFEAEPVYRYADDERETGYQFDWREPWPYTAVTFRTTRAGYDIEMHIEPGYKIVRLRLRTVLDGAELLDLDLRGVRGVGVERIHGRELLRVDFPDDSPASTLWLRMKPYVALHWSYGPAKLTWLLGRAARADARCRAGESSNRPFWYERQVAYFEDLSAYSYSDVEIIEMDWGWLQFRPGYDRINVGWLDASHAFEEGPTPNWFADALLDIIAAPRVNTMRGHHRCPFCPERSEDPMLSVDHPTGALLLGHSEIRVPSGQGVMFAAPSLIWHYVTAHSYRPPAEFIEAVKQYDHGWTTEPSPWIPHDAQRITFD